jgi:hypothetical protein
LQGRLGAAILFGMIGDSAWVQKLRGWCEQFSALADALEQDHFRFSEDGRDVSLKMAADYRRRADHFEQLIADTIAASAAPV